MKRDFNRNEGNRVVDAGTLLQEGNSSADHSHVSRTTPFQTKRKEVMADPQYQADAMNTSREKRTTALRRNKDTRPL